MKVGVCQLRSTTDPWFNLLQVDSFIKSGIELGVEAIFFPENVFYRGPKESALGSRKESSLEFDANNTLITKSDFSSELQKLAEGWTCFVSLGSVFERSRDEEGRFFNSHVCRLSSGQWVRYRKIHLFDFSGSQGLYQESREVLPGHEGVCLSLGAFQLGLSICYDLRFPELFRYLALHRKSNVFAIPAAFTRETGQAHWHTLLRARAIENMSYVIASAQWGDHQNLQGETLHCYGHSLVFDPWGTLLGELPSKGDGLLVVELDLAHLNNVRKRLPALQGAKFFQSICGSSSQL